MPFLTRIPFLAGLRRSAAPAVPLRVDTDPQLVSVARAARAIDPEMRVGMAAETLRMSPYRTLAVVENGLLIGVVTEAGLLSILLGAMDARARAEVREKAVREAMEMPPAVATPMMRVSEAATLFDRTGQDALPVTDYRGSYLGMVGRADLVQDLVRPFRPPTVGGMATPLGVYLTTGAASGGAGTVGLLSTGLFMFLVHLFAMTISQSGVDRLDAALGAPLPDAVRGPLGESVFYVAQLGLFLLLLRLSPVAGYHAAEHQVVHALERSEPLLVETVRRMPRVHPRCGTNLVAGLLLVSGGYTLLSSLIPGEAAVMVGMVMAITYWRSVGSWLQQNFTTRPATDRQIESGIAAARELLDAHGRAPYAPAHPLARLWRMGFPQILGGFALGYALLIGIYWLLPAPLHAQLEPWANQLLAW